MTNKKTLVYCRDILLRFAAERGLAGEISTLVFKDAYVKLGIKNTNH
jgi:hypothetical protein